MTWRCGKMVAEIVRWFRRWTRVRVRKIARWEPLVNRHFAIENGPFILDFRMKIVILVMLVYPRVTWTKNTPSLSQGWVRSTHHSQMVNNWLPHLQLTGVRFRKRCKIWGLKWKGVWNGWWKMVWKILKGGPIFHPMGSNEWYETRTNSSRPSSRPHGNKYPPCLNL